MQTKLCVKDYVEKLACIVKYGAVQKSFPKRLYKKLVAKFNYTLIKAKTMFAQHTKNHIFIID